MKKKISKKVSSKIHNYDLPISKSTINTLWNQSADTIILTDEQGNIIFWNKKAENVFGFSYKEIIGKPIIKIIAKKYRKKYVDYIKDRSSSFMEQVLEVEGLKKDEGKVSVEVSVSIAKDRKKYIFAYIVRDISEKVKLQQKLYQQTITDSLTGLYNRRSFDETLKIETERARRYNRPFSVIVMDIDNFKQINDSCGHMVGDEMLIKAKDVFLGNLRKFDTAYRYGGDEFGMALPETSKKEAIDVAERLRSKFAKKCAVKYKRIKISLSLGVASFPEDGRDDKSLIGAADKRMYHSKSEGGNIVTAYSVNKMIGSKAEALFSSLSFLAIADEENRSMLSVRGISHSQKTRALALEIARRIGLNSERMAILEQGSMLHDIGMIFIPKKIVNKTGKLTDKELMEIKKHPLIGEEVLEMCLTSRNNKKLMDIPKIVGQHHEWINGQGYPRGLKGNEILIEAKILKVVDAYDSMSSGRYYRKAFRKDKIIKEMKKNAGKQFDPNIVNLLLKIEGLE